MKFSVSISQSPAACLLPPVHCRGWRDGGKGKGGFGFWVVVVVILILLLAGMGGASHFQNRGLHRSIAESYLGRSALMIAGSAVDEVFCRLSRFRLSPRGKPPSKIDWVPLLTAVPDGTQPVESITPAITRQVFLDAADRPRDFTVRQIDDVVVRLVNREMDIGLSFWTGVLEFDTAVSLSIGQFPAGVAVTRRLRIRKRYFATQTDAMQSPTLRFLPEDVSREVVRQ